jgi:hypothetical protein
MSAATSPLTSDVLMAQEIILSALNGDFSGHVAVQRLARLLCTPEMNMKLVDAGALADLQRGAPTLSLA